MKTGAILPITRLVSAIVCIFLVIAFMILYLMPDRTGELFAWKITPRMSSMFLGAAYLGGAWILFRAAVGKHWHQVHAVFPAVTVFASAMLLATLLHWDRFAHGNLAFTLWVILYVAAPFLIPSLWIYNKRTDTHEPEPSDAVVSATARLITRLLATGILLFVLAGFLYPALPIGIWPWELTPLTARAICGWLSVIGVSAWVLAYDPRWTAWRAIFEGISIAAVLILTAEVLNSSELTPGIFNGFTVFFLGTLFTIIFFYLGMENQRKRNR